MKKPLAILLLCCYSLALFRPLFPLAADFMAHTFWKAEHMATVHYENGQYHVHLEMKNAADKQDSPAQSKKEADESTAFHLQAHNIQLAFIETASTQVPTKQIEFPLSVYLPVSAPPPWSC